MSRVKNLAVNVVLNGLLCYALGRWLRGHRTGVRLGLLGGAVAAIAVLRIEE